MSDDAPAPPAPDGGAERDGAHRGDRIDRDVVQAFWDAQAAAGDDLRACTLDRDPAWWVRFDVRGQQRWLFRHLAAWRAPLGCAVDVGCGVGAWTVELARRADRVIAADLSPPLLAATGRRVAAAGLGNVELVHADARTAPLPAGTDLIVLGGLVQYLDDDDAAALLARAAAALAPGGVLYLRTTTARRAAVIHNRRDGYHADYRARAWYDARLADAGLDVAATTTGTDVVATEAVHRLVGGALWPTLGRALALPLRAARRVQRARMATEIHHWLARRPG